MKNLLLLGSLLLAMDIGCSGQPAALRTEFAPSQMATDALAAYDANSDGQLAGEELDAAPAIKKNLALYDKDGNGSVAEEELEARFEAWDGAGVAFRRLDVKLTLDGRPLQNATITFEPEVYMTDWVRPATGTTGKSGMAKMSVAAEDLPAELKSRGQNMKGVYVGAYKVKVEHPSSRLPEGYRSGALLGEETSRDALDVSAQIDIRTRG
ncbi:hypothetical protein NG895_04270 [Aeoliella sp. ICT_H6.2]|uniref:EF hand domain-containing protein n=1 Tax=Aeoliella straminimaris TaxID=2954799 RepID=A0A9X2F6D8_9BACT|nr:hypothetical protein [Aeoliella straminimaris]MCO6043112.1 hypothetical protein [Aeoliella straminimaris]